MDKGCREAGSECQLTGWILFGKGQKNCAECERVGNGDGYDTGGRPLGTGAEKGQEVTPKRVFRE